MKYGYSEPIRAAQKKTDCLSETVFGELLFCFFDNTFCFSYFVLYRKLRLCLSDKAPSPPMIAPPDDAVSPHNLLQQSYRVLLYARTNATAISHALCQV